MQKNPTKVNNKKERNGQKCYGRIGKRKMTNTLIQKIY